MSKQSKVPKYLKDIASAAFESTSNYKKLTVSEICEQLDNIVKASKVTGIPLDLKAAFACLNALCGKISNPDNKIHSPHFLQLIAAIALYEGKVIHVENGEGKTLAAAISATLRAKEGKQVHISTQNDYLVCRDATWNWPLFDTVGLSVAVRERVSDSAKKVTDSKVENLQTIIKQNAYQADILYANRISLVTDFLNDNLIESKTQRLQRNLEYVIIDEIDSTLIDDARDFINTAISLNYDSQAEQSFRKAWELSSYFQKDHHFEIDNNAIYLTESGIKFAENKFQTDIFRDPFILWAKLLTHCLKARHILKEGVDYKVIGKSLCTIDERTKRPVPSSRFAEGLHQVLLLKENLPYEAETTRYGRISIQNYYRQYDIIAGMSGSVWPVQSELKDVYNLSVIRLPTQKPVIRIDDDVIVSRSEEDRNIAIIKNAISRLQNGQSVLIGVEDAEIANNIHKAFYERGINPSMLTASDHENEAKKIQQLFYPESILISAKMAGRGTDIKLSQKVLDAGGLHVIIVGMMEKRVEEQLRGRAGRQGLPGSSSSIVSLDDNIMQMFGGTNRIKSIMDKLSFEEGEIISHPWVTKALKRARRKKQKFDFLQRKGLFEADSVIDSYRDYIYKIRSNIINSKTELDLLLSKFTENLVSRLFEHARRERNSNLDDSTQSIIQTLCRDIEGLEIDDFEAVGATNSWNSRSHIVGQSLNKYIQNRAELVRLQIKLKTDMTDAADILIGSIIRDSIDYVWSQFLRKTDQLYHRVTRQQIGSASMGNWMTLESHEHFITALADIEYLVICNFAQVSNMDRVSLRDYLLELLTMENCLEDISFIIQEHTKDAIEKQQYTEILNFVLLYVRNNNHLIDSFGYIEDLYNKALMIAFSQGKREVWWEIAIEATDAAERFSDESAILRIRNEVFQYDPILASIIDFIFDLNPSEHDFKHSLQRVVNRIVHILCNNDELDHINVVLREFIPTIEEIKININSNLSEKELSQQVIDPILASYRRKCDLIAQPLFKVIQPMIDNNKNGTKFTRFKVNFTDGNSVLEVQTTLDDVINTQGHSINYELEREALRFTIRNYIEKKLPEINLINADCSTDINVYINLKDDKILAVIDQNLCAFLLNAIPVLDQKIE